MAVGGCCGAQVDVGGAVGVAVDGVSRVGCRVREEFAYVGPVDGDQVQVVLTLEEALGQDEGGVEGHDHGAEGEARWVVMRRLVAADGGWTRV